MNRPQRPHLHRVTACLVVGFLSAPQVLGYTWMAPTGAVQPALALEAQGQGAGPDVLRSHPARDALVRAFSAPVPPDFRSTGLTRADYLRLIAGNVDFFLKHQDARGAIIDPVSKGERQYSTPAFAASAGLLVKAADRPDLLEPASRALTFALDALVARRTADNHPDFYIPMLVHAFRSLKASVSADQVRAWEEKFRAIDHERAYRADLRGMNWNVVSSAGELLRRHDRLVAEDRVAAQMEYLERCLGGHLKTLSPVGLFVDPGAPLAYDAFSRLWLEDVFADDAYSGAHADTYGNFLRTGGLSTLLLLSPSGEWASGGRSGLHNWADAQVTAICEMNAAWWAKRGRPDVAGAFKRAARLSFASVARWQRPSGELWIVKNRAEPDTRLAFERYSNHSQYNLLAMAMLAIAYSRADESIAERPTVSEVGGYVFDARETFHKVAAAAGGYFVLIDTAADPGYNATGLQRVHRAGVSFPALSDSAAPDRKYQPAAAPKAALAPGVAWRSGEGWLALADFPGAGGKRKVERVELDHNPSPDPSRTGFTLAYHLRTESGEARIINERYTLSADGVELTHAVSGTSDGWRLQVPVLVNDGATDTLVGLSPNSLSVSWLGSETVIAPSTPLAGLALTGERLVTHNGWVRAATAELPDGKVTLIIRLAGK